MATYLLKKSYQLKDLKEINLKIFGEIMEFLLQCGFLENQQKFYFLNNHLKNLILSLKKLWNKKKSLKKRYYKNNK